ncbi:MAG TPA: hypothetical protein VNN08_16195 [Thermoanaerobaculia bacterium]|nr:hypothetical protein [Thermoanaerobaculia bacterium]
MKRRTVLLATALFAAFVVAFLVVSNQQGSRYETWEPGSIGWSRLIRLDESAPGYWWVCLRMRWGGFDSARLAAEGVVARHPTSAQAHYNLGVFLYAFNPARAKVEFERARQLDPKYRVAEQALLNLAQDTRESRFPAVRK